MQYASALVEDGLKEKDSDGIVALTIICNVTDENVDNMSKCSLVDTTR